MSLVQNISQRIPQFHKNVSKTSAKSLNATNTSCLGQQSIEAFEDCYISSFNEKSSIMVHHFGSWGKLFVAIAQTLSSLRDGTTRRLSCGKFPDG